MLKYFAQIKKKAKMQLGLLTIFHKFPSMIQSSSIHQHFFFLHQLQKTKMLRNICSTFIYVLVFIFILSQEQANGALHGTTKKMVEEANKKGPYLGLVIPNLFEMNPLLSNPEYKSTKLVIDYAGTYMLSISS